MIRYPLKLRRIFSTQYDPLGHSMLGNIMCFETERSKRMSYGIVNIATREAILVDPMHENIPNYAQMLDEQGLKIRASVLTGRADEFEQFYSDFKHIKEAFSPKFQTFGKLSISNNKNITDLDYLKPVEIGDLCICFLECKGLESGQKSIIAITEVNETSSKLPLLFTGDLLEFGSIGKFNNTKDILSSIRILNSMPSGSIFFPKYRRVEENMEWIKKIDDTNAIVNAIRKASDQKEQMYSNLFDMEKMYNPYLRLRSKYYQELLEETDEEIMLRKLKKFEENFKKANINKSSV